MTARNITLPHRKVFKRAVLLSSTLSGTSDDNSSSSEPTGKGVLTCPVVIGTAVPSCGVPSVCGGTTRLVESVVKMPAGVEVKIEGGSPVAVRLGGVVTNKVGVLVFVGAVTEGRVAEMVGTFVSVVVGVKVGMDVIVKVGTALLLTVTIAPNNEGITLSLLEVDNFTSLRTTLDVPSLSARKIRLSRVPSPETPGVAIWVHTRRSDPGWFTCLITTRLER